MDRLGTALSKSSTKALILGAGELAKEVVIELQRLGVETIAVDRYSNAPAMQVSHRSYVINMLDKTELSNIILKEDPQIIIPEIEAINTEELINLEKKGFNVIPNSFSANATMNRETIRNIASKELKLVTSDYRFANSLEELENNAKALDFPCLVKPIMSSSGKGQSLVLNKESLKNAWDKSQLHGRSGKGKVIIESFINFDYEITLLTAKSEEKISFCEPIGHKQENGDYIESWQPHPVPENILRKCHKVANKIVSRLSGNGIFGVELFIKDEIVFFSEVSPRPHDTGMVTLISQDISEFEIHVKAILGISIPNKINSRPSASVVIKGFGKSNNIRFEGIKEALEEEGVSIKLFGKPSIDGSRRLGVILAHSDNIESALEKANKARKKIKIIY